jgi:hypothetical protein
LRVLTHHSAAMDAVIRDRPAGPWMYAVTSTGLRPIDLE